MKRYLIVILLMFLIPTISTAQEWASNKCRAVYKSKTGEFETTDWKHMTPLIITKKGKTLTVGKKEYTVHYVTENSNSRFYSTKKDTVAFMFTNTDSIKILTISKLGLKPLVEFKIVKL